MIPRAERGYAMVAAVGGIAVMAAIAATLVLLTTSRIDVVQAEMTRARMQAAADAGVIVALGGLTSGSAGSRWTIDGEVHDLSFDGIDLKVHIEDEHGKIMLHRISDDNIGWLLEALGISGQQFNIARDSFVDWTDQDDDTQPDGAESEYYNERGLMTRNDSPQTIDELGDIRGFTPQLIDRFRQFATVDPGNVPFNAEHASPLAIQVMTDGVADSPTIIQRRRELAGQRTAIALSDVKLENRTVSVVVVANGPGGAQVTRRAVAKLGAKLQGPWTIRYIE